jgi:hypothetical protein
MARMDVTNSVFANSNVYTDSQNRSRSYQAPIQRCVCVACCHRLPTPFLRILMYIQTRKIGVAHIRHRSNVAFALRAPLTPTPLGCTRWHAWISPTPFLRILMYIQTRKIGVAHIRHRSNVAFALRAATDANSVFANSNMCTD